MDEDRRFLIKLIVAIIGIIVPSYLTVAGGDHLWPFSSAGSLPAPYQNTWWNGQIQIPVIDVPIQLTLRLGSGGLHDSVGSISSSTLGCAEKVYLEKADAPVTLKLSTSGSSPECAVAGAPFDNVSISLIGADLLKFTVDVFGVQESCELSR